MTVSVAIPAERWLRRSLEIFPAALAWGTLLGLSLLAFWQPFWVAVFIIAFDLYALIRAAYMSVHLLFAYRKLKKEKKIDYLKKCKKADFEISWDEVEHAVILPTYDESLTVLRQSLQSLVETEFPKGKLHVVVGFEERAGEPARERAAKLTEMFASQFASFVTTWHPADIPGEAKVKSANASWAMKKLEERMVGELGIPVDRILVSNFDSDTVVAPEYFSHLTYAFIKNDDRYRLSYQPLPIYNNNVWDAPAFSRVIATGSTFWQMIESTRPERLVTFSSHSMTLVALKDVGYWDVSKISEDSRIFWQCLLHYDGDYRTEPLYTTVSMDAALSTSWWKTLVNQYKQKRRWAWGIENFPYLTIGFMRNKKINFFAKMRYLIRTIEGHWSWATTPIIIAGLGWLPIFFGGADFHQTFLSYSLPFMARAIMSIAMSGLLISTFLSLVLLPPRPENQKRWRYVGITMQWALVPVIATFLSALPALDAETRLALGRDLNFNVMEKARKNEE